MTRNIEDRDCKIGAATAQAFTSAATARLDLTDLVSIPGAGYPMVIYITTTAACWVRQGGNTVALTLATDDTLNPGTARRIQVESAGDAYIAVRGTVGSGTLTGARTDYCGD